MDRPRKKPPRRNDDRIILHFDYDCFYAQVIENQQPALKSLPLGIKQKSILATCNYEARRCGVKKLMSIAEAKTICPELVLADGEDLSLFRDVSKRLYSLLRSYSWNGKIERLGLDEVFLDVTDIIAYNAILLNRNDLPRSFFYLSAQDPEQGFEFDASAVAGCVRGSAPPTHLDHENALYARLLLASHLARFLRMRIEEEGYTSASGISTNKLLSKLAGSQNKPRNQTTLLTLQDTNVLSFMDAHILRQVPGIGSKMSRVLEAHVRAKEANPDTTTMQCSVTSGQVRNHHDLCPQLLERLLGGPGSEKGIGERVWSLLHGVDNSDVKAASDVPSQISIEDTYRGLNTVAEITAELRKLSASLLRRMHVDVVAKDDNSATPCTKKWLAHPKTLRLTTRPYTSASEGKPYNFHRTSRSQPLPQFVFDFTVDQELIIDKLVQENLLPMFHKLNPEPEGWRIGLLNICVTNMVLTGTDDSAGNGRDIADMFRKQQDVLREFTVYAPTCVATAQICEDRGDHASVAEDEDTLTPDEGDWADDMDGMQACARCGHFLPQFAAAAHERYHTLCD